WDARVEASFRVRYSTLDQLVVASGRDLSKGGMFLATRSFLPTNAVLRLALELPAATRDIPIIARVAYVRADQEATRTGQPAGMGVQFLDISSEDLADLARFISAQSVAAAAGTGPVRARSLDLVIVDDVVDLRELAGIPFRARGDQVRDASNGVEALALCLRQ